MNLGFFQNQWRDGDLLPLLIITTDYRDLM